jgi:hypothetical protein
MTNEMTNEMNDLRRAKEAEATAKDEEHAKTVKKMGEDVKALKAELDFRKELNIGDEEQRDSILKHWKETVDRADETWADLKKSLQECANLRQDLDNLRRMKVGGNSTRPRCVFSDAFPRQEEEKKEHAETLERMTKEIESSRRLINARTAREQPQQTYGSVLTDVNNWRRVNGSIFPSNASST